MRDRDNVIRFPGNPNVRNRDVGGEPDLEEEPTAPTEIDLKKKVLTEVDQIILSLGFIRLSYNPNKKLSQILDDLINRSETVLSNLIEDQALDKDIEKVRKAFEALKELKEKAKG